MGAKKEHITSINVAAKPKVIYVPSPDEKKLLDLLADIFAKSILQDEKIG